MQYTLIFDWMFELGGENPLSLSEVLTYAQIYSFSRNGSGSYIGSFKNLTNLTHLKERQQINVINKLVEMGLIIKIKSNYFYQNEYKCNISAIPVEFRDSSIKVLKKTNECKLSENVENKNKNQNQTRQLDFAETGLFNQKEN